MIVLSLRVICQNITRTHPDLLDASARGQKRHTSRPVQTLRLFTCNLSSKAHRPSNLKDVHPSKAPSPMAVTGSGIVMLAKDSQPSKALLPMAVTDSGIVMLAKDSQPSNAPSPMAVTDSGIVTLAKDRQIENAWSNDCH